MHTGVITLLLTFLCVLTCSCHHQPDESTLRAPSIKSVSQDLNGKVTLLWEDSNTPSLRDAFVIELKQVDSPEFKEVGRVDGSTFTFTLSSEVEARKSYFFSVTACHGTTRSFRGTKLYGVLAPEELRGIKVDKVYNGHAGIGLSYTLHNLFPSVTYETGIIISTNPTPEPDTKEALVIPSAKGASSRHTQICSVTHYPRHEGTLYACAYAKPSRGEKVFYSDVQTFVIKSAPQPIKMEWIERTPPSLEGKVNVYSTSSTLNGRPFRAWYAIGNPEKTGIKRNDPRQPTPLSEQAAQLKNLLVLINASYFWGNTSLGLYAHGGLKGTNDPLRGSLKQDHPEYDNRYPCVRGFFGVDEKGKARILWGATTRSESGSTACLYPHPLSQIIGEGVYSTFPKEIMGSPIPGSEFTPRYGVSGGPVLLKDGEVPFDFEEVHEGGEYYWANFEIIPYDIFGKTLLADRTAVGITTDGKVVLFVCDGRLPQSKGATLLELAQVMKGIGCADALNLDGGGSTNMWVDGEVINHQDIVPGTSHTRPIKSVIGFFNK